jgi:hypothetical protein
LARESTEGVIAAVERWAAIPVHPILVAAYPVLFLFRENADEQVTLAPLWIPLVAAMGGGAALWLVCAAALRDLRAGALLASFLIALFFGFGHAWNLVGDVLGLRRYLAAAWLVLALIGIVVASRRSPWFSRATRFTNVVAVLAVAMNVLPLAEFALALGRQPLDPAAKPAFDTESASARRPEIYYLIFDRYASATTLATQYGYDNSPFLSELERRGFFVAEDSWANYLKTGFSLSSSLQMEYLDGERLAAAAASPDDRSAIYATLRDHLAVPVTLKALGYEYVQVSSFFEPTATNVDADLTLRFEDGGEFSSSLLATTFLSLFESREPKYDVPPNVLYPEPVQRAHTLYQFDVLPETRHRPGPTFVFAHFLVPHPPYTFDRDGSQPTSEERAARSEEEEYVRQLEWTNDRILETIDALLDVDSGEEPVIIIQADEGPFPGRYQADQPSFDWLTATEDEVARKMGILNAYRLPIGDPAKAGLYASITPVNSFRVVFNTVFGASLPLLPDRYYLYPSDMRQYEFVEIDRP